MAMEGIHEAKGERRKSPKMLVRLSIEKAKNGGHVVTHHVARKSPGSYNGIESLPEEQHVFGPGDGEKMMAHVGKHMGVKAEAAETEGEQQGDEQPAEGEE